MNYSNEDIQQLYANAAKNFKIVGVKKDGDTTSFYRSALYKMIMAGINKAIRKFETGENKDYYAYINNTRGEYNRRKGGNIYDQMKEQANYASSYLKDHKYMQYSLLGVYVDLWNLINDQKWKIAWKKAYDYCDKNGEASTIATAFKMMYIVSVVAFETIGLKIVDFKFAVYSGASDVDAIQIIQSQNKPMMKNLVTPAINLITLCNDTETPANLIDDAISTEKKAKESKEDYDPKRAEEDGFWANAFKAIGSAGQKLYTGIGNLGVNLLSKMNINGAPIWVGFTVLTVTVVVILAIFPLTRMIIYYASMHKVNLEKRIELEAELVGNNVNDLKEKLENTKDAKEKARLQEIIDKQQAILDKIRSKVHEDKDDDIAVDTAIGTEIDNDDSASKNEAMAGNNANFNMLM